LPDNSARGTFLEETLQYPLERLGGRHAEPRDTLRAKNRVERSVMRVVFLLIRLPSHSRVEDEILAALHVLENRGILETEIDLAWMQHLYGADIVPGGSE
jgi:hypothetical protein